MRLGRLISALCVCLAASVPTAAAQPKKAPAAPAKKAPGKQGPLAPAKDAAPAPAPAAGGTAAPAPAPGGAAGGEEVQMSEDAPPADLEGRDENPDAPRIVGSEPAPAAVAPEAPRPTGYPLAEAARPITLPQNTSEVSLDPHAQVSSFQAAAALRARYGITSQVQLGLAYVLGGVFDDPLTPSSDTLTFQPGKAVGLDVTVLLQDWVGVRVGVPFYIDPVAVGITLAAPMKWRFAGGKFALGALDELVTIKVKRFAPSLYQEARNAGSAAGTDDMGSNTTQSRGALRFSAYGVMQRSERLAFIARIGVTVDDFSTTKTVRGGGLITAVRAGLQYSPRRYLDLGVSLGFDDLAAGGSFGPAALLAFRI